MTPPNDPLCRQTGSAPEASLAAWMAAAQRGDEQAYRLFMLGIVPLLRHAARHLEDPAAIEDAVQDTLRTVHQLRHTFEPGRAIRPWVTAIAERRVAARLALASRPYPKTGRQRQSFGWTRVFRKALATLRARAR